MMLYLKAINFNGNKEKLSRAVPDSFGPDRKAKRLNRRSKLDDLN